MPIVKAYVYPIHNGQRLTVDIGAIDDELFKLILTKGLEALYYGPYRQKIDAAIVKEPTDEKA